MGESEPQVTGKWDRSSSALALIKALCEELGRSYLWDPPPVIASAEPSFSY